MQGIFHDYNAQVLVASTGKVMLVVPYPVKVMSCMYYYKSRKWENPASYLTWEAAFPLTTKQVATSPKNLLEQIQVENYDYVEWAGNYYKPKDFTKGLKFLRDVGSLMHTKLFYSPGSSYSPLLFTDDRIKYIFMPMRDKKEGKDKILSITQNET